MVNIQENIKSILKQDFSEEEVNAILKEIDLVSVSNLFKALENSDSKLLKDTLTGFSQCSIDHRMRQEQHERLGHLARQFQQSLLSFRDGLGARIQSTPETHGQAQAQIESVIKMTHDSAMTVMELGQKQLNSFQQLVEQTNSFQQILKSESNGVILNQTFEDLSTQVVKIKQDLEGYNQHLIMSQSYQDITGQVLIRVKAFIDSVESGLIEIVKMLAYDTIDEELAQIDSEKILNNCDQNDVDELLSSLGF